MILAIQNIITRFGDNLDCFARRRMGNQRDSSVCVVRALTLCGLFISILLSIAGIAQIELI